MESVVPRPMSTRKPSLSRSGVPDAQIEEVVRDCAAELKVMDGGTVLITGATGWFGTWLLDILLAARDLLEIKLAVTALSRDPGAFLRRHSAFAGVAELYWQCGDVRDLRPASYTYVLHAATDSGANAARVTAEDMFATIVHGTERAIGAAGAECRGFLLFSSGAIYGSHPSLPHYSEDMLLGPDPSSPRSCYAEAKRVAETLCAIAAQRGVPARIARCFAFVGPHMAFDRHFAIGNFIADALAGRAIRIRSDGTPVRSYLYMTDLVRACLRILVRGQPARPYNVGSDLGCSVAELAKTVNSLLGGVGVVVEGAGGGASDRYLPDIARLRRELDFEPRVHLGEAILKTAAWYRTQMQ